MLPSIKCFLSSAVERDTSNVEVSRSNRLGSLPFAFCFPPRASKKGIWIVLFRSPLSNGRAV
jgi:hypothetical protein